MPLSGMARIATVKLTNEGKEFIRTAHSEYGHPAILVLGILLFLVLLRH
jgi:hypothetical protein